VPLGRIRARLSCTVVRGPRAQRVRDPRPRGARPVFTALARPTATRGTAQLGLGRRSARDGARRRSARQWRNALLQRRPRRCTGDGQEGVGEAHRRVDDGAARLGVDDGVG
jgi:hypothetical protein